jgi:hypothetical protein
MSNVMNGHALVYGISPTTGATVQIGGFAKCFLDSLPVAHRAKMDEHTGTNGLTQAIVHTNQYFEIGISFRPASTTTQASADTSAFFPLKGATMALSGFKSVRHNSADILNGDWIIVSDSTVTLNASDPASIDLTLRRYLDGTQMTTLKTLVPAEEA